MGKPTSKFVSMNGGKKMRVALGSLYVLNKPILAHEHGPELLTNTFEILVVMSVGFSKAGSMVFYVIAIRKCSLFKRLGGFFKKSGGFFKKLRKTLYRMTEVDQSFLIYFIGIFINRVINDVLKVSRYYYRESEIICTLKLFKNNISEIIKDVRKDPNICKKPQDSKLVELIKNNIDKIIRAMLIDYKATISIKRKHLLLFESHLWCDCIDILEMKWHEVGRMINIEQWPIEAIRLWATHQLCLPPESLEEIAKNLCLFNDFAEIKKITIESIQKNNVSKRSVWSTKGSGKPKPYIYAPSLDQFVDNSGQPVDSSTVSIDLNAGTCSRPLLDAVDEEDSLSDEEFYDRNGYLRREKIREEIHDFGR